MIDDDKTDLRKTIQVANMYFIPTAIFNHHPDITVTYYVWKSLIPALLGNIIGGSLFVGVFFWYLVSSPQEAPQIFTMFQCNVPDDMGLDAASHW